MRQEAQIRRQKNRYTSYISRADSDSSYCAGWVDALAWALGQGYGTQRQRPEDDQ